MDISRYAGFSFPHRLSHVTTICVIRPIHRLSSTCCQYPKQYFPVDSVVSTSFWIPSSLSFISKIEPLRVLSNRLYFKYCFSSLPLLSCSFFLEIFDRRILFITNSSIHTYRAMLRPLMQAVIGTEVRNIIFMKPPFQSIQGRPGIFSKHFRTPSYSELVR